MHSNARIYVHLVWATFNREPLLPEGHDEWLRRRLKDIATRNRVAVGAVGNAGDHVHAVIRLPRDRTVADIVQRLKGASAHDWNVELGERTLRWQPGYWAESVAPESVAGLLEYVRTQRVHHTHRAYEPWEAFELPPFEEAPSRGFSSRAPDS